MKVTDIGIVSCDYENRLIHKIDNDIEKERKRKNPKKHKHKLKHCK